MTRWMAVAIVCALPLAAADTFDAVMAEQNLEKRSEKALQAAQRHLDEFRKKGDLHDLPAVQAALADIRAGVELCVESLESSGKNARRNPKYFKKAEIGLRKLNRQLEDLRVALPADDRHLAANLLAYTHQVQEDLLLGIFTKKK